MSIALVPGEIQPSSITFDTDITKAQENFQNGVSTQTLCYFTFKNEGLMFRIQLDGEVATNGIITNTKYVSQSFAFRFINPHDTVAFTNLKSIFDEQYGQLFEGFEYKPLLKNDQLWIKCKYANDKYSFETNFKGANPKKPIDFPISKNSVIRLYVKLCGYANWDIKTYGFTLDLCRLEINP